MPVVLLLGIRSWAGQMSALFIAFSLVLSKFALRVMALIKWDGVCTEVLSRSQLQVNLRLSKLTPAGRCTNWLCHISPEKMCTVTMFEPFPLEIQIINSAFLCLGPAAAMWTLQLLSGCCSGPSFSEALLILHIVDSSWGKKCFMQQIQSIKKSAHKAKGHNLCLASRTLGRDLDLCFFFVFLNEARLHGYDDDE